MDSPDYYAPELEQLPANELLELAEQVEDLQAHPAWQSLVDLLESGKANLQKNLIFTVHEHASYAHKSGFLAGMEQMPAAAQAVTSAATRRRNRLEAEARAAAEAEAEAERI